MNKSGFTLIELLIVVAIIGILAVIGIPAYIGQQKNAARTEAYTNLQNLAILEAQFFSDKGRYSPCTCVSGPPATCTPPAAGTTLTLGVAGKDNPTNSYDKTDNLLRGLIQRGGAPANATDSTVNPELNNALPGFKPGSGTGFSYWIVNGERITNVSATPITNGLTVNIATDPPCFVAFAQGNSTSRNNGEIYAVDCNNTKNF